MMAPPSFFLVAAAATMMMMTSLSCSMAAGEVGAGYYREVYPPLNTSDSEDGGHLFFALVQSFGSRVGSEFNGSGNIAGIQVALDRINRDPSILPNHVLHYTLTDSEVPSMIV